MSYSRHILINFEAICNSLSPFELVHLLFLQCHLSHFSTALIYNIGLEMTLSGPDVQDSRGACSKIVLNLHLCKSFLTQMFVIKMEVMYLHSEFHCVLFIFNTCCTATYFISLSCYACMLKYNFDKLTLTSKQHFWKELTSLFNVRVFSLVNILESN